MAYIENTGNASEGYRIAYNAENMKPETINRAAKELIDNPKIAARIDELMAGHVKRHKVTIDSLTTELEEAREMAKDLGQPATCVTAAMGKAKLHGLLTEKHEHSGAITLETIQKQLYGDDK